MKKIQLRRLILKVQNCHFCLHKINHSGSPYVIHCLKLDAHFFIPDGFNSTYIPLECPLPDFTKDDQTLLDRWIRSYKRNKR